MPYASFSQTAISSAARGDTRTLRLGTPSSPPRTTTKRYDNGERPTRPIPTADPSTGQSQTPTSGGTTPTPTVVVPTKGQIWPRGRR